MYAHFLLSGILSMLIYVSYCSRKINDPLENLSGCLKEYKATGRPPFYLKTAAENYFKSLVNVFDQSYTCTICYLTVDLLIELRKSGINDTDYKNVMLYFCNLYGMYNERVCEGMVTLNSPILLYIIDNTSDLNATDVCGIAFQYHGCASRKKFDWSIDIPAEKEVVKSQATCKNSFNILHISDIHYDPRYTTGKTNKCGEPLCCQDDQANGTTREDSCGYWSDYIDADTPWRTVANALEQTKSHAYEYVYFTGDIIPHRIWNTSKEDNSRIISQILDAFADYYKVPVYPVLGNHEAHPADVFSEIDKGTLSTKWLFEILFQKTSKWLPIDEVRETILRGGYYTVSPRKGFRIIALNNNVCVADNWWLLYNPNDPYGQLKWLVKTLLEAEAKQERVHIIHHVPSGRNECYKIWAREYRRIIDRFSYTIAAQFNGHTHRDEFYVYYNSSNSSQALSMAWNGASVVTYDKANPSYKVLSVDGDTFDLLDFEEWTFNLTLANLAPGNTPEWYKLYSFKKAYGVRSLQAEEINNLVLKMTQKHELIDQYYRYKFRNSDVALKEGCDDHCKKDLLCTMVKTEYGDNEVCDKVRKLYDGPSTAKVTIV